MYTNLLVKKPFIEDDKTQKRVVLSKAEIYDFIYSINSKKNGNLLQILLGKKTLILTKSSLKVTSSSFFVID
jgi:hypothetical protein